MTNLSSLPAVGKIVDAAHQLGITHAHLTTTVRDVIEARRRSLATGEAVDIREETILKDLKHRLCILTPTMSPVINASGVLLHTNLGRAVLSEAAKQAILIAASTVDVEFDLATGLRGDRHANIAKHLQVLTGCEAAVVVNNNAAATLLSVAVLGKGRDVILSRGEMVEIGGQFRMPDVIEASGCRLVGVGATNRTHPEDYVRAINDRTGCILRCHRSNFDMVGFVSDVPSDELSRIAKEHNIPFGEDLGAGALVNFTSYGISGIRTVQQAVNDGVDLIWFSGDKLIGGPQAGIIVGSSESIDACKKHPLMRALRPDKLTLAALEATLLDYVYLRAESIPFLAGLALTLDELNGRAARLLDGLSSVSGFTVDVVDSTCAVGAGAAPTAQVPSRAIRIVGNGVNRLYKALITDDAHVIGQVRESSLLLDMRSIQPDDEQRLKHALRKVLLSRSAQ